MSFQMFATLFIITVCASASTFPSISSGECLICKCNNFTADCSNLNLSVVPVLPSNITRILLTRNNFKTVSKDIFVNVKTLTITTIKLDYCHIKYVSSDAFVHFPLLKHLNISGNKNLSIEELSNALTETKLTHLNLDDVGLRRLLEVGSPFSSVNKLSLRKNLIKRVNITVWLIGFPSLRNLDLTDNMLDTFPFTANLGHIQFLNLTDNRIESNGLTFCVNDSSPPNKLQLLDLSWNYLSDISVFNSEGHCLSHLGSLILSNNNHIFKIPNNVFSRLPSIRRVLLRYVTGRVEIEPMAFNSSTLTELRLTTSEQLYLQEKHIDMFNSTPNLQTLHFTNVIFKDIPDDLSRMFSNLTNMIDFKIKNGIVWNISFLSTMKQLKKLDLFGNYIKTWNNDLFKGHNLQKIVLTRNQIAVFVKDMFPSHIWKNLEYFTATSNPLQCTCDIVWFRDWLAKNTAKLGNNYPELYTCLYPDKWKNFTINEYKPDRYECDKSELSSWDVVAIGISCLTGVLLLLAAIVYKGRYHIKHRMYLVRSLQPYNRLPDGEEFLYDAFVAHHVDDRGWVINHLLPFLEKQRKLRLCLHERDFLPGNFIADNITDNMKASRKVLLIFSHNFSRSEWCLFEATTAYQRILTQGTSTVVIIMLEDILQRPVSDTIRNLLDTVTYITWDNEKRQKFFQKLLDAIQ
ncbi:LOW QUALITY PROTEIN: toll-like receptor 13 [Argopecten irradians]|uniref:LOW QUALITY PROTEIN: toll-like receptor 13 n=1 Tax=Argopecten irradians TaxID=31199 RepID=UPI0037159CCA